MENKVETMEKFLHDQKRDILFARVASNLLRADKVDEAQSICEHGLKKFPAYAPGHYILAKCYLVQRKFDEARVEFERVLRYDPNHLNALLELSHIYKGTGLKDIYKDYLVRLLNLDPLNDTIRAEAKSVGIYHEKKQGLQPPPFAVPAREASRLSDFKTVDLSQFDNLDDDFDTILQGRGRKSDSEIQEEEKIRLGADDDSSEHEMNFQENRPKFPKDLPLDREEDVIENNDEFEDLNELEFGKEGQEENTSEEQDKKKISNNNELESWAEKIRQSDTTEILINPPKSSANLQEPPEPGYEKLNIEVQNRSENDDEPPSEFKQPKIVSQTLGEILVSQKKYQEALGVFKTLQKKNPSNESINKKIAFITRIINLEKK